MALAGNGAGSGPSAGTILGFGKGKSARMAGVSGRVDKDDAGDGQCACDALVEGSVGEGVAPAVGASSASVSSSDGSGISGDKGCCTAHLSGSGVLGSLLGVYTTSVLSLTGYITLTLCGSSYQPGFVNSGLSERHAG